MYTAKWGRIRQTNEGSLMSKEGDPSQAGSAVGKVNEGGGYSFKSSSNDCLVSTIISLVNSLPLGKLTFTENRRTIIFQPGSSSTAPESSRDREPDSTLNRRNPWMKLWMRLKRFFGKS